MESQKTIRDGYPFFVKGEGGASTSLICLSEKVGSTAWKLLFNKVMAQQGLGRFDLKGSPHKAPVTQLPHAEQEVYSTQRGSG